jgi:hypothetical protein
LRACGEYHFFPLNMIINWAGQRLIKEKDGRTAVVDISADAERFDGGESARGAVRASDLGQLAAGRQVPPELRPDLLRPRRRNRRQ